MNLGRYDCATGLSEVLWSRDDLLVRTAVVGDAPFIDKLQRENAYAVGFIQRTIWDRYVFGGERNFFVLMCEANFDPVGYTLITPGRPNGFVRIQQIAVRDDARRLHYGDALVSVVRDFCIDFGRRGARLRCRRDLDSNQFWRALQFQRYAVWPKGKVNHVGMKASDDINLWERVLNATQGSMFEPTYLSATGAEVGT